MNLLIFGDLHIADKPPGGRVDDYMETILGKLGSIAELCKKHKVTYAIGTGDVFHIKQGNRVTDYLRQRLITAFKDFPCEVYVVPGNHDYGPAGLDSLHKQPLGTLEKAGAITILRSIEDSRLGVWIVPRPYNAIAEGVHDGQVDPSYYSLTEEEETLIDKGPAVPVIGIAHGSLVGPGDSRQYPTVDVSTIPGIAGYDLLVSGHIHESLGVVQVGEKTIFANPGSISRTRRDLASYSRTVEVLIVTVTGTELVVDEVPLPNVRPALEVFGRREVEDTPDMDSDQISNFVKLLGQGLRADELSLPELLAELGDLEPEVKAVVQHCLEEAD